MSEHYRFSHLFNSQNPNTLGLELEHKLHTCAKDGRQDDGGLCPPIPMRTCVKKSALLFNLSDFQKRGVLLAGGSFTSIQSEKWLYSSLPMLTKAVALC